MDQKTIAQARNSFDFLVEECGFDWTPQENCLRYDAPKLYFEVWFGSGDHDILVGLKVDTPKIRPGMSHLFNFARLMRYYHQKPLPTLDAFPQAAHLGGAEKYFFYYAFWTKKYLMNLLKGNIAILDQIR